MEENNNIVPIESREIFGDFVEKEINELFSMWKADEIYKSVVNKNYNKISNMFGIYQNVPILCRGEKCPYRETCDMDMEELTKIEGRRCPAELATIFNRFKAYCKEFEVTEDMTTDLGQIKELIDIEIMILRCDSKIAISPDIIERQLIDVTKSGIGIYEDKVNKASEFKLELYERHSRILKNLNADRASKKKSMTSDASKSAALIMQRMKEMAKTNEIAIEDISDYEVENDEYIIIEEGD